MFRLLGQAVRRGWALLLVGWAVLLAGTWLAAPSWDSAAREEEFAFLPTDAPTRQAHEIYTRAFPEDKSASNVVLVLHRETRAGHPLDRDLKFIEQVLEQKLRQIAEADGGLASEITGKEEPLFPAEDEPAKPVEPPRPAQPPSIMDLIRTPNAPGSGALLASADRKTLLVVVELTQEFTSHRNWPVIAKIEQMVNDLHTENKIPAGLEISLTGSAVMGRDHSVAELESVRATGLLTMVLVAVLLILIYRAPLLALIPLATVFLAVQIALNLLALLAEAGYITLFSGLKIYITILAYGAGVDYCLFLTARYKEELDGGATPSDAVASAVTGVGVALAASAGTVICGIAMMMFAQFGKFQEAGFAIPLSLLLVLCGTLTFSPALLCLAGKWAFWPRRLQEVPPSGKRVDGTHSGATGAPVSEQRGSRGALDRLWEKVGALLVRRAGTVWLIAVAIMAPFAIAAGALNNRLSYDVIGDLPAEASSTAGTRLLHQEFPAGIVGPVTVLLVDKQIDFSSAEGQTAVARLTDHLEANRRELGLADIRSLSAPLGITASAKTDLVRRDLPEEGREEVTKHAALEHYTTAMGERGKTGTRLELVLDWSPFARESVDNLPQLEQAVRAGLPEKMRSRSQLYFLGATASVRDLATVMQQDRSRIEVLVVAAVFVILVLLLRGFVISIYLLLSVIFSYFTALGVTFAVFWLADPSGFSGIDWRVAIFLFTILIAVGEDYNIFLMTRVDEEQKRFGPVRGITEALDRTGPIITSCGIIMAGTFASLLIVGSLTEMKQLGFALAFGVLLDTFVVRPILVPSFLIMLCTGRLPLLGRPKAAESVPPETTQARPCAEPMGTAGKADRQSQRAEPPLTPAQSMHDAASGGVHPRRAATPPG